MFKGYVSAIEQSKRREQRDAIKKTITKIISSLNVGVDEGS